MSDSSKPVRRNKTLVGGVAATIVVAIAGVIVATDYALEATRASAELRTTNRDLDDWVQRKRFRADLFYRLNVLPVHLSALREHSEDIAELVAHFLDQAAAASGGRCPEVSRQAMSLMVGYEWPGNVRELENICRRAATLCPGKTIEASLVQPWLASTAACLFAGVLSKYMKR